jgi:hypothetical protein
MYMLSMMNIFIAIYLHVRIYVKVSDYTKIVILIFFFQSPSTAQAAHSVEHNW